MEDKTIHNKKEKPTMYDLEKIAAIISMQYDLSLVPFFTCSKISVIRSSSTKRIKYIYFGDKLLGTLRATDERFVPTLFGAKYIMKKISNKLIVKVSSDAAEWVSRGRTVFCKHVIEVDENIRPGEEVFVVDEQDNLIAIGKAVLSGREIKEKKKGKAVKVRRGLREDQDL
ncbi:MAG: hypothetical protein J7K23_06665 [Thermoproteales archaeon]|nr:hypothetical protein [Thermoproteales archaeon]